MRNYKLPFITFTFLSLLFAMTVFLPSCDSQVFESELVENSHQSEVSGKEQIRQIADSHNEYLEMAIQDFDYSTNKPLDELQLRVLNEVPDLSREQAQESVEKNKKLFLDNLSQEGKVIVDRVVNEATSINSLELFNLFIQEQQLITQTEVDGQEQTAILIFLAVTANSAELWLPVEMGGSGIGYDFLGKLAIRNGGSQKISCLGSVIVADGLAAAGGFVALGVSIAIAGGPVTIGAAVGALYVLAGEAAFSSATTAILNCL